MASEGRFTFQLQIIKGNLTWRNSKNSFVFDVGEGTGPGPGHIQVPTSGIDVYFPGVMGIVTPGVCVVENLDSANYVEWGIKDPQTNVFYALGEVLAGEAWPVRLSRNLGEQYAGSGTGTTTSENYLRLKANKAAVNVNIFAFGK